MQLRVFLLVPRGRVELPRSCDHGILSPARLPVPPPRQNVLTLYNSEPIFAKLVNLAKYARIFVLEVIAVYYVLVLYPPTYLGNRDKENKKMPICSTTQP